MGASVETLCAVTSVEEKCLVLLDLGELVPQTFDLSTSFQPDPSDVSRLELASDGATRGGRVAILDSTLVGLVH